MGHRSGTDTEKILCPVPFPCPKMFAFFAPIQFLTDYVSFSSKLKTEALRAAQRIDEHQLMKNKSFYPLVLIYPLGVKTFRFFF
jgi:hypothetical protein